MVLTARSFSASSWSGSYSLCLKNTCSASHRRRVCYYSMAALERGQLDRAGAAEITCDVRIGCSAGSVDGFGLRLYYLMICLASERNAWMTNCTNNHDMRKLWRASHDRNQEQ
jgi:hypothetical protein